jgi:hypothetical protein
MARRATTREIAVAALQQADRLKKENARLTRRVRKLEAAEADERESAIGFRVQVEDADEVEMPDEVRRRDGAK